MLDRAEAAGGVGADQLVVVLTDGNENASRRWTRAAIFDRITRLQEQGWTFVFLGANQDSYATGGALGVQQRQHVQLPGRYATVSSTPTAASAGPPASGGARAEAAETPTATGSGATGRKPKNCRRRTGARGASCRRKLVEVGRPRSGRNESGPRAA